MRYFIRLAQVESYRVHKKQKVYCTDMETLQISLNAESTLIMFIHPKIGPENILVDCLGQENV